jgi:CCR4-NOT transcription complex subunit 7/8
LKIIQLGITFADENGEIADDCPSWQFNFHFDIDKDQHAKDSIELLKKSGIDFISHEERGIDISAFGELLMSSGLVLNDEIHWISFHSGYDFGYLLKVLTHDNLPMEENDFFKLLTTYFPIIYDVKYMMNSTDHLKGGLNKLAEDLEVERVGPMHQAGSDSLLTAQTFFKLRRIFFPDSSTEELRSKFSGILYGLGVASSWY